MMVCFECGNPAECDHHVVPKVLGGTKTVPLCLECHGKVHGRDFLKARRLQLEGIKKAREAGKMWGGRKVGTRIKLTYEKETILRQLHAEGVGVTEIARRIGLSRKTVYQTLLKVL